MIRLLQAIPAVAAVVVLSACTSGAPTGATLPALTTSSAASESTDSGPDATSTTTAPVTTEPTTTESARSEPPTTAPVDVTVPPEASALPLPTEQVNIPADNAQEEADRAAIEAVWRQVWELFRNGYDMPEQEVRDAADRILTEPVKSQFVDGLISGDERDVTSYGSISLHPYWYRPVAGLGYAVVGDCADFSQYGEAKRSTGEETSRGRADANRVGQFIRSPDGTWKMWNFTRVNDVPCDGR